MPGRDPLPNGTTLDDLRAAIQAAWLVGNYAFVRALIERYFDTTPVCATPVCFRCVKLFRCVGLYEPRPPNANWLQLCAECFRATALRPDGPEDGPENGHSRCAIRPRLRGMLPERTTRSRKR